MILFILKIIGIVLLVILGILLLVTAALLFVPIRYMTEGAAGAEGIRGRLKIYWLLHIVTFLASYEDGETVTKLKIFGICIKDSSKPPKKKKEKKKEKKTAKKPLEEEEKQAPKEKPVIKQKPVTEEEPAKAKETFWQKVKRFFKAILDFLKNIRYTIRKFCDRIKKAIAKIKWYLEILESERFKKAYALCKTQLLKVLQNIKPKKVRIRIHAGFDDPSVTGQILAFYSMAYPFIYDSVIMEADFENTVLEGDFFIKGRITLYVVLKAAWKIYFDRNIRELIQLFEEGGNENGRQ